MFGINDDDGQAQPAGTASADDAPVMPKPVGDTPANDHPVNPISGNETLGPPQVSSGLPSIIPGAGGSSSIKKSASPLPPPPPPAPEPQYSTMPGPLPHPDEPEPAHAAASHPASHPAPHPAAGVADDELLDIKKEALQSLTPLVDELDLAPPEKFKTLMMLMQASDNPSLVKEAYETANKIDDEKARARALLDVVNEINYFTHPEKAVDSSAID